MEYGYHKLESDFNYEAVGSNIEEQLLDACRYRNAMHVMQVIGSAMRENPKLTLVGFEQFFRTQENNEASQVFLLSAPPSTVRVSNVIVADIRDYSILKSRYLWICVNGALEMAEYMDAFGIEDNLHNLSLLATATGTLVQLEE